MVFLLDSLQKTIVLVIKLNHGLCCTLRGLWTPSKAVLGIRAASTEDYVEKCLPSAYVLLARETKEDL